MRFKFLGFGSALIAPLVLTFDADTFEAARESGLRVLQEVVECEQAELRGPDNKIVFLYGVMPTRRRMGSA